MDTKNYTLMSVNADYSVTLGIIQTLKIAIEHFYDIKPSKKWGGGKRCRVISINGAHARCVVGKTQGRGYYATTKWLPDEYDIPFGAFVGEWM